MNTLASGASPNATCRQNTKYSTLYYVVSYFNNMRHGDLVETLKF